MNLSPNQAHVWTLPLAVGDDALIERLLDAVLSDAEIARASRFKPVNSRHEYIAAHALGRIMLSAFADVAPRDWQFETGPHGRPEISGPENSLNLRFNISHTRGRVCVAVIRDHDIGIDIEWRGRDNLLDDIALAKFARPELAQLDKRPESEKRQAFFSFWTLKESYIKAIGRGLSEPLDGFAFSLDSLTIDFLNGQDDSQAWQFQSKSIGDDYTRALAVRCGVGSDLTVREQVIDISSLNAKITA
ncbi:MAG TPA: 4'-phosphopantetheinyl transferase superfamily protein [Rhodospirillales bacterium]|nr:4'-phosphopantetheinyl transferase superfamily protein [Rhodospirillales bacterium]